MASLKRLSSHARLLWLVAPAVAVARVCNRQDSALAPMLFNALPLGAVQPASWLRDQLNLQANGLAGHEYEFYNYVAQSTWTGGTAQYSDLHEDTYEYFVIATVNPADISRAVQTQATGSMAWWRTRLC